MIELKGKRNSALIFADKIDKQTKTQIAEILRQDAYSDSKIRIMPDTHSGKNVPVGTTMTVSGRISPSLVGVDIGCGMETVFIKESSVDLEMLDSVIHSSVPAGNSIHQSPVAQFDLKSLCCYSCIDNERAQRSLGTLGGGNHFIELDRSEKGELILVIHSGSRQLGSEVAEYYKNLAYKTQIKKAKSAVGHKLRGLDDDGYSSKFQSREKKSNTPKVKAENAVLEGKGFDAYLSDVETVTSFADMNRRTIADIICSKMGFTVTDRFSCVHNYIDTKHMILRKGAISARLNERVIIPLNMRDGAVLGLGLGNPLWNFSAPHGAGRICSRTDAKYAFTLEEYQEQMNGIYTTTATMGSIDECPMAYKPSDKIIELIADTIRITDRLTPIYNFKSC